MTIMETGPVSRKEKRLRRLSSEESTVQQPETRKRLTLTKSEPVGEPETGIVPSADTPEASAPKSLPAITGNLPVLPKTVVLKPVPVLTPEEEEARNRREALRLLEEQEADDKALKRTRKVDARVAELTAENEAKNEVIRNKKEGLRKAFKREWMAGAVTMALALVLLAVVLVLQWIWS